MMQIYTIGGYGHTEDSFLRAIKSNSIDLFVDVRQRRGMRGSAYAFLNAKKLEQNLLQAGVSYLHLKNLAPTNEVRDLQKSADRDIGAVKRSRDKLSQGFIDAYQQEVLRHEDKEAILKTLDGHKNICFFCVEKHHEACHRSVLTDWLEPVAGKARHI